LGKFFNRKKCVCLNLAEYGLRYILGDFFPTASGHPASQQLSPASVVEEEEWVQPTQVPTRDGDLCSNRTILKADVKSFVQIIIYVILKQIFLKRLVYSNTHNDNAH
jgi:hypothetical protein